MTVIATTLCYPSPDRPTQGIFVHRRLAEIHRLRPVRVVAPVLWFPGLGRGAAALTAAPDDCPPVWRPRMFYLPGVLKSLDARWYQRALETGLAAATAGHEPIDLIDAHFEWPDGVGAYRVARSRRLPFICTLRGKLVSALADPLKRRQIRDMLVGAEAIIAVSVSLARLAEEVAGRSLNVRVIPNGIDTGRFHRTASKPDSPDPNARAALGLDLAARYVVAVGHLQFLKGFDRLIEIWSDVRRRGGDVRLVLIGGSAGERRFEQALRRRMEQKRLVVTHRERSSLDRADVILTGILPPEKVALWLNAADLFVLASRSEGWCNALTEALACGCPAVAVDVGGNREQIRDPSHGLLVPSLPPPELAEALTEAILSGLGRVWDRDRIALENNRRNWQQVARECVDVWDKVAAGRSGRVAADPNPDRHDPGP